MNTLEQKMCDCLKDLRENHNVVGVKAEFEAEGTRLEEALRLKEVVTKAGLELTIKIGGCEAIKDMYDARAIGVNAIVAPMIESAYALKKFIQSIQYVYPEEERKTVDFYINLETIQGYKNFDEILSIPELSAIAGIVYGRVDMSRSLGLTREDINSEQVFEIAKDVLTKAKKHNLKCTIGGGVSADSFPFFQRLPAGTLDRYETRKVIFSCPTEFNQHAREGILKAVGFELMWLKNKRNFYGMIYKEDEQRIAMLEARYARMILDAGGRIE